MTGLNSWTEPKSDASLTEPPRCPNPTDLKRKIKGYSKQLYANKFDNVYEMNNPLKNTIFQNGTQEEINDLKSVKEVEFTIKIVSPTKNTSGPHSANGKFYQTLKK